MKVLLHIGHHKTGSTALQRSLAQSRRFLRRGGILYPRLSGWWSVHHALFPHFFGVEYCDPYVLRRLGRSSQQSLETSRAAWQELRSQVARLKPEKLILSSETFFTAGYHAQMERLGNILRELSDEIEIVCYVRNPAEWVLSSFSTQIQMDSRFQWPPPGLREDVLKAYEVVRPAKFHVIKYASESLLGGNITQDFGSRFIEGGLHNASSRRINVSLSAEAMVLMEKYVCYHRASRKQPMPLRQQLFRRILRHVDSMLEGFEEPRLVPAAEASIMRACTDLAWLEMHHAIAWSNSTNNSPYEECAINYGGEFSVPRACKLNEARLAELEKIMTCMPMRLAGLAPSV